MLIAQISDPHLAGRPRLEPQHPGFQLHMWRPDLGLVTHSEYLEDG